MPTRFYLPATSTTPPVSPATLAWTAQAPTGFVRLFTTTAKINSALTNQTSTAGSAGNPSTAIFRQYISDPLTTGTVFNGQTVTGVIRGLESVTSFNATVAIGIQIVSETGTTQRVDLTGVDASDNTAASPPEFAATAATRRFQDVAEVTSLACANYTTVTGDRLVIEVGYRKASTSTTATVTLRFGDPTASADFAHTDGLTTDLCPWVEFSGTITFATRTATPTARVGVRAQCAGTKQITVVPGVAQGGVRAQTVGATIKVFQAQAAARAQCAGVKRVSAGRVAVANPPFVNHNQAGISDDIDDPPLNFGYNTVVVDPQDDHIVYFGTNRQGIWKSTNAGDTWVLISTGTPTGPPGDFSTGPNTGANWALSMDHYNGAIYTSSGHNVQGVWKSTDGGVNWVDKLDNAKAIATDLDTRDVYTIDCDPWLEGHLICTFHYYWEGGASGIIESYDGGDTWTKIGPEAYWNHNNMAWFGNDSNTIMIGMQDSGGVWITHNHFVDWTQITTTSMTHGAVTALTRAPDGTLLIALASGTVIRSTDDGDTWVNVGANLSNSYDSVATDGVSMWTCPINTGDDPLFTKPLHAAAATNWTVYGPHPQNPITGEKNGPVHAAYSPSTERVYTVNWRAGLFIRDAASVIPAQAGARGQNVGTQIVGADRSGAGQGRVGARAQAVPARGVVVTWLQLEVPPPAAGVAVSGHTGARGQNAAVAVSPLVGAANAHVGVRAQHIAQHSVVTTAQARVGVHATAIGVALQVGTATAQARAGTHAQSGATAIRTAIATGRGGVHAQSATIQTPTATAIARVGARGVTVGVKSFVDVAVGRVGITAIVAGVTTQIGTASAQGHTAARAVSVAAAIARIGAAVAGRTGARGLNSASAELTVPGTIQGTVGVHAASVSLHTTTGAVVGRAAPRVVAEPVHGVAQTVVARSGVHASALGLIGGARSVQSSIGAQATCSAVKRITTTAASTTGVHSQSITGRTTTGAVAAYVGTHAATVAVTTRSGVVAGHGAPTARAASTGPQASVSATFGHVGVRAANVGIKPVSITDAIAGVGTHGACAGRKVLVAAVTAHNGCTARTTPVAIVRRGTVVGRAGMRGLPKTLGLPVRVFTTNGRAFTVDARGRTRTFIPMGAPR